VPELTESSQAQTAHESTPPKQRRRLPWKSIVALGLIAVLALCAPLVYGLGKAGASAALLQTLVKEMVAKAVARDFTGAENLLGDAEGLVDEISSGLRATGFWRGMPVIGKQITALEDVARAGSSAIEGGRSLLRIAATLEEAFAQVGLAASNLEPGVQPTRSFRDLTVEEKRTILARFYDRLPDLRLAREKIDIAADAWARVPQDELFAPIRRVLAPIAAQIPLFRERLDQAVPLIELLVPMAGYPDRKTYLVLLQNDDEMRATGGFIGTVGLLTLNAGDIEQFEFKDVYAYDNPATGKLTDAPPEIMKKQLGVTVWYLRDSNWSPDFPTSAERIIDVFRREVALAGQPTPEVTGVIALQSSFFKDLLALTGPITIEDQTFDSENFFDKLEYAVEMRFHQLGIPTRQRKEILSKVGDVLMERLMQLPSSQWPSLLAIVTKNLARKEMQIYDRDPALLRALDGHQWSGRVLGAESDYLLVIDSNLAAYKTDGVMRKDVRYSVDLTAPGGPTATVLLTYRNDAPGYTWRYTRYRDYVRIYVPEGSELISSEGAMFTDKYKAGGRVIPGTVDTYRELGKQVFGAFWSIEPKETRTLRFTYRLPPAVVSDLVDGTYQLLVQRQSGTNTTLTLDHVFGKNVVSATPPEAPEQFGDTRYRASIDLVSDTTINVTVAP
jgi:hypothetical protein